MLMLQSYGRVQETSATYWLATHILDVYFVRLPYTMTGKTKRRQQQLHINLCVCMCGNQLLLLAGCSTQRTRSLANRRTNYAVAAATDYQQLSDATSTTANARTTDNVTAVVIVIVGAACHCLCSLLLRCSVYWWPMSDTWLDLLCCRGNSVITDARAKKVRYIRIFTVRELKIFIFNILVNTV